LEDCYPWPDSLLSSPTTINYGDHTQNEIKGAQERHQTKQCRFLCKINIQTTRVKIGRGGLQTGKALEAGIQDRRCRIVAPKAEESHDMASNRNAKDRGGMLAGVRDSYQALLEPQR